jgi:hypothetical protein
VKRLSVIVIVHDMRRAAPRTLYTLSAAHQRGVTEDDYEVIVVENGSSAPLDPAEATSFGANFRYVRLDGHRPSPGPAINAGVAMSDAPAVAIMIDGARMVTPGAVAWALRALDAFDRTVIATIGFHLGEFQPVAVEHGYDEAVEDELLASVDWRADGYRLFEIAGLAGSSLSGWFAPLGESNLVFMPRTVFDELGGYDEAFVQPGGGLVNLDFYKRAAALEDVEWLVLLGEATFHQIHGGAATNRPQSRLGETLKEFQAEYKALRGKTFIRSPRQPTLYGALPPAAKAWLGRMAEGRRPEPGRIWGRG